ncbi:glycosyltransferase family 4 protein [Phocaeicola vulgatus]|uniref:glycosyltransferase family 4 protein n=1 Tax=Phocaeicola vulgatus TaxID=821 RepID=UPI001E61980D|nr:glycosyltransferase family 4 protein [Phocaeicola vulgatus]
MNKLLFVLGDSTYPYRVGGMEIFNHYIIQHLKKTFKVSYLARHTLPIIGIQKYKCYKLHPTKYLFPLQLFFCLLFHPQIKKVLISYSAAHAVVWRLYTLVCKILKRKYYVVIHYGDLPPESDYKTYSEFFLNASAVVAVSNDIKRNYDKKFGIDCQVIFPLVPFNEATSSKKDLRVEYNIPSNANVVCMVGTLKGMKNPDTIIEALHSFSEEELKQYAPHIVYAGGGPSMESLKTKVAAYGLSDYVTFLGNVPKEKVNQVYKLADIYLIASDFEGTSVSLLEAMFNNMPIIASRVPGIVNTVLEEECLMFSVKDAIQLKDCLLKYIQHPELAKNLSSKAFNHYMNEYNYEDVVKAYQSILNS